MAPMCPGTRHMLVRRVRRSTGGGGRRNRYDDALAGAGWYRWRGPPPPDGCGYAGTRVPDTDPPTVTAPPPPETVQVTAPMLEPLFAFGSNTTPPSTVTTRSFAVGTRRCVEPLAAVRKNGFHVSACELPLLAKPLYTPASPQSKITGEEADGAPDGAADAVPTVPVTAAASTMTTTPARATFIDSPVIRQPLVGAGDAGFERVERGSRR